ncbi:MAG: hypothetical protein U0Z53_15175 [Blastocatellia bacterium]
MSYSKKFEELRDAAKRKAEEMGLKEKLEQGVRAAGDLASAAGKVAGEAASKGAETISEAAKTASEQARKFDEQYRVTDNLRNATTQAGETFKSGAQAAQSGVEDFSKAAEERAREVFGTAEKFYRRAEQAYNTGTAGARLADAAISGYGKTREWIKNNPGKTAVVSLSLIAGIRAGSAALPNLGVTILGAGAANNWLLHSSLPIIGLRKVTERYHEYLKEQERRIASGEVEEAERASIEFQRNLTKYVGAPLLGAFSVAAGATMIGAAFSGATATGFPVSLILGGNPLLNGIWFFANGVICISEGYKFFMIALADEEEVQRVVREIKGLLPAAQTAQ